MVDLAGYAYAGPQPARSDGSRDDLAEVQATVTREFQQAKQYIESNVGPVRAQATRYYLGMPFGDEEEGRSAFMSRDVRDTVLNYLPSLMRVLFGSERPVEFVPTSPEKVALAEQVTDFMNLVVLRQDNDGFAEFYAAIKDALVRKAGFLKWWWDETPQVVGNRYTDLDELGLMSLATAVGIDSLDITRTTDAEGRTVFDAVQRRTDRSGRARFEAVPPEELLVNSEATNRRDARCFFHRRILLVNDLVLMGYPLEEALAAADSTRDLDDNEEYLARRLGAAAPFDAAGDDMLRRVLYIEGYLLLENTKQRPEEAGGETIYSLHKVCCAGSQATILTYDGKPAVEPVSEFPFAVLCTDPEPHTFFGTCPADMTMDIQRVKSQVQRGMLDSLSLSIEPRTEVVEAMVNLHDLMNPEVNRVVRVRQPGMMREIQTEFLGAQCLPVLSYYDQVIMQRTKQNEASQGLDADALQSMTQVGVEGTLQAAQAQQELTARVLAEGGVRDLFRGLLRLYCQHPQMSRMVQLRGKWTPINPREWDAEMDVSVNVALGTGGRDSKLASLMAIKGAQELVLQTLGPQNPMVTPYAYRTTLVKMAELGGWPDPSIFFPAIPPEYQPPTPPPAPDATTVLARVQMAELNMKAEMEAAKLRQQHMQAEMEDATRRYIAVLQAQASVQTATLKAGSQYTSDEFAHSAAITGQLTDAATARHVAEVEAAAAAHQANREAEVGHAQAQSSVEAATPEDTSPESPDA